MIPRHPRAVTSKAIHENMEMAGYSVTRRTIERDLQGFADAGFPVIADTTQEPYLWSWDAKAPALSLPAPSVSDALLLAMVKDYVGPMLPPQMLEALQPYLDRAVLVLDGAKANNTLANWRDKVHAVLPTQALIAPAIPVEVQRAVSDALLQETQLEITYDSMSGKKGQAMTVHPHALIHRGQMSYLVCTCWDYTGMRRLAMHRVRTATNTYTPMVKQPNFNLPQYLVQGHGDFGEGGMRNLDIKVSPDLAAYLGECKLTVDQKLTPVKKPADWFRLTAQLPDTPQLRSWLLSHGEELIVKG
jgi:predicted DNA-binding transcriptional regulator YafY